jgi:hypothetical protein
MTALYTVLFLWAFYVSVIFTLGVYRAQLAGRLSPFNLVIFSPVIGFAWAADVTCNWTLATMWFLEPPISGLDLVTNRLTRYLNKPQGGKMAPWRVYWAQLICRQELDPFDPTGNHCTE